MRVEVLFLRRRTWMVGLLGWASIFAVLTVDARAHRGPTSWDRYVHRWVVVHRVGFLDGPMRAVTHLGTTAVLVPLLVLGALAVWWRRRTWRPGLVTMAAYVVAVALHQVVATWVKRGRPPARDWIAPAGGWSYTSGHTTQAWAGWLLLAALVLLLVDDPSANDRSGARAWKIVALAVAALVATSVSLSRIWLGVHWPTDVLGGAASSMAVVCLLGLVGTRTGPLDEAGDGGPLGPGAT